MARLDKESSCRRCHFDGNRVGAAAMILPAKSIICMPCHTATFSVGDTITILALIVFVVGLVMAASVWSSGSLPGETITNPLAKICKLSGRSVRVLFSSKVLLVLEALFLDVLLQRRLFRQSPGRWLIHSMIFLPFVFRFTWGLVALCASVWRPEWTPVWDMLNKNHPTTAFLFDLTGIMVILGAVMALIRGLLKRSPRLPDLPGQDILALGLIAGIVILGFVLEGMRIAMTGWPSGATSAFLGFAVSRIFTDPARLAGAYGYVWYAHALLTGAFVAYLPFSRMLHIIMAPVVLILNAVSENDHGRI
jgi:nitrate reductase gamma subunit